jgi:PrsW family intramembrane metalloprotease
MDSKPRGTDWRSLLLVIFALSGAVIAISSAIGILVFMALNKSTLSELNASPLTSELTASTLIAIGLLLLPVAWLSVKRLRNWDFDSFFLPPLRLWEWIAIPGLWLLAVTLATVFQDAAGAYWYIPFLHFFSIALPIYFVMRIATNRIPLGSSQRAWGVFGIGMTLSPFLAIIAEVLMVAMGILAVAVYLGFNPEKMREIEALVNQLGRTRNLDTVIYQVGPMLKNPLTLLVGLTFLSFLVPIIEETAKSMGVWLVSGRISSPAQGFALGVLGGAGFALAESLTASLTADRSWAATLSIRAISSSMHMLATGLLGWGIAYARLEKRYLRLIGMMLLAMSLHAAWNAGAVLSVWGGARVMIAMPGVDFLGTVSAATGAGLLFIMMAGMFVTFFVLNGRLRTPSLSVPLPTEAGEASRSPEGGQDGAGGVK